MDIPTADLPVFSLGAIFRCGPKDCQRLLQACSSTGCFYVEFPADGSDDFFGRELRNHQGLSGLVESMYRAVDDIFDLPLEEKIQYDADVIDDLKRAGSLESLVKEHALSPLMTRLADTQYFVSYKPIGRNAGGLPGKKDAFETFAVATDDIFSQRSATEYPNPIVKHWSTIRDFAIISERLNHFLLKNLSAAMKLKRPLEELHRPATAPCPSMIRLLRYQPFKSCGGDYPAKDSMERAFPHIAHTDTGTTTVLFTRRPGLQIYNRIAHRWEAVPPTPSEGKRSPDNQYAIVNLGDGISLLTDAQLVAPLHRVVATDDVPKHPKEIGKPRRAFGYFLRAEANTPMTGSPEGLSMDGKKALTSEQWLRQKFRALRMETYDEDNAWRVRGAKDKV